MCPPQIFFFKKFSIKTPTKKKQLIMDLLERKCKLAQHLLSQYYKMLLGIRTIYPPGNPLAVQR